MKIDYVSAAVGISVFACGCLLWSWQKRQQTNSANESDVDRPFRQQQKLRRTQTAAVMASLGLLILLSDFLPLVTRSASAAAWYILAMLFLAVWLLLLGLGDALASRIHLGRSLRRDRQTRNSLQETLAEYRERSQRASSGTEPSPQSDGHSL